jgi:hypothetical protein
LTSITVKNRIWIGRKKEVIFKMAHETIIEYTAEDLRQISNGGAEGFCFRGPQEIDPLLGVLNQTPFGDVMSIVDISGELGDLEIQPAEQGLHEFSEGIVPQGKEIKL